MKNLVCATGLLLATTLASCASTQTVGYVDGAVTTSKVHYSFVGPPHLQADSGQSYHAQVNGYPDATSVALGSLQDKGLSFVDDPSTADVAVTIELADSVQGEAGAMKLGGQYVPAFEVRVPYEITIVKDGACVAQSRGEYTNFLTMKGSQRFATREEAVGAMDFAKTLGKDGIEQKARKDALPEAVDEANELAARLFEEREISMEVPVVRSAAGLEFEEAYQLIAAAEEPSSVRTAMEHYERQGLEQTKPDGSPNTTANYGVACGMAACELLLGNLSAAWEQASVALAHEPQGKEVEEIRHIIYQQEVITGQRVIPEEQRAEIDAQLEQMNAIGSFLQNLGG